MPDNEKRNLDIGKLLDSKKLSYSVIAKMMGTTRCAVAGVAFRRRYPHKVRKFSPNGHGKNKIGHGYQRPAYQPKKTAHIAL